MGTARGRGDRRGLPLSRPTRSHEEQPGAAARQAHALTYSPPAIAAVAAVSRPRRRSPGRRWSAGAILGVAVLRGPPARRGLGPRLGRRGTDRARRPAPRPRPAVEGKQLRRTLRMDRSRARRRPPGAVRRMVQAGRHLDSRGLMRPFRAKNPLTDPPFIRHGSLSWTLPASGSGWRSRCPRRLL